MPPLGMTPYDGNIISKLVRPMRKKMIFEEISSKLNPGEIAKDKAEEHCLGDIFRG